MVEDDPTSPSYPNAPASASNSSHNLAQEVLPVIKGDPLRDDPSDRSFMGSSRFATRYSLFTILGLLAIGGTAALFFHADQLLSKSLDQIQTASHLASLVSRIEATTLALNSD